MKRIFTHWFLIGDTLSTYPTIADGFGDAAGKFGANVKGITAPGYSVVKDELCKVQISNGLAEHDAQLLEKWADGWHGGLADLMRKEVDRLRSESRLTETQQAAQRILKDDEPKRARWVYTGTDAMFKDPEGEDDVP